MAFVYIFSGQHYCPECAENIRDVILSKNPNAESDYIKNGLIDTDKWPAEESHYFLESGAIICDCCDDYLGWKRPEKEESV